MAIKGKRTTFITDRLAAYERVPEKGERLNNGDLQSVCEVYKEYINHWNFMLAAYDGIRAMVARGVGFEQHERESNENFKRRIKELYSFGYSRSVVDLFNFYLFKKPATREVPNKLSSDELYQLFMNDCNLYGDSFDEVLLEDQRHASAVGHVGILVDKSSQTYENRAAEIENRVYPYIATYLPQDILWWEYERDINGRPRLIFLKLRDDDGYYRLWWPNGFEVWKEVEDDNGRVAEGAGAELISEGSNPLGEIPFVWLINIKGRNRPIGLSDIEDIAYIDASITRNLSQGEEVITYAAFPILTRPKPEQGMGRLQDDLIGPTAVFEFDPELPDSRPQWMEAKVSEPIEAILNWIKKKVEEIYRASNAGGMAATEISKQAKSGAALRTEFQLLNSKLVSKGTNIQKAEQNIMYFWLKWSNAEEMAKLYKVERPKSYEVENLSSDLANVMTANTIVKSQTFIHETMKKAARQMLPGATPEELQEIDREIEAYEPVLDPLAAIGNFGDDEEKKPPAKKKPVAKKEPAKKKPAPKRTPVRAAA
jgi:hypothetical protein